MASKNLLAIVVCAGVLPAWAEPSFTRDIKPLLQKHCSGCHQPAAKASNLDVTTYEALKGGGTRGTAFVVGAPGDSLLVKYMTGAMKPPMPMGQPPLPAEQIDLFRQWIQAGGQDDSAAETTAAPKRGVYHQAPVITALRFSPDGESLAVSGNGEILLHKADGSGLVRRMPGDSERLLAFDFSKDGALLVAGGGTPARFGEVQFWDPKAGKLLRAAKLTNDTVFGASLSSDGQHAAVGCTDNTVHVFDPATAKELYKIGNHENWVLATVFSVDGKRFVSVGRDRAAKLIDSTSGAFLENVNLLRGELTAVARHPQKDIVVLGGEDRIPYVYTMDRPKNMKIADDSTLLLKLDRQNGVVSALAWSPDGKQIAVAGAGPEVNLYAADGGALVCAAKGHAAGIYAISFSPDSKSLAAGGFDGHVRIYDTATCTLKKDFIPVEIAPQVSSLGGGQ